MRMVVVYYDMFVEYEMIENIRSFKDCVLCLLEEEVSGLGVLV